MLLKGVFSHTASHTQFCRAAETGFTGRCNVRPQLLKAVSMTTMKHCVWFGSTQSFWWDLSSTAVRLYPNNTAIHDHHWSNHIFGFN